MICFYHLMNCPSLSILFLASQLMWITEKKDSHNIKNMKHNLMLLWKQKMVVLLPQSIDQSDLNNQSSYGFWRSGVGALDQQSLIFKGLDSSVRQVLLLPPLFRGENYGLEGKNHVWGNTDLSYCKSPNLNHRPWKFCDLSFLCDFGW